MNAGTVSAGQYVPLGAQFENVAGGDIAVKDAVKVGEPVATGDIDGADQIWIWNTASSAWTKYYFYMVPRTRPAVTYWVKEGSTDETTDTIPAGTTFFFKRSSGATGSTTLTLAGGVKDLTGSASFSVTGAQLAFVSNPWPMPIVVKNFNNYITSGDPVATGDIDGADQIWLWDTAASAWTKYYFYMVPRTRPAVTYWVKEGSTDETTDTIPVGKGIFFKRSSGASATEPLVVTFKNATAE